MIYGYARVSTDGQSVEAQVAALTAAGAAKVFREVASGAKTDRAQLQRQRLDDFEAYDMTLAVAQDAAAPNKRPQARAARRARINFPFGGINRYSHRKRLTPNRKELMHWRAQKGGEE